jgi:glycerol-3-phosphate acyltransferase PlsY
MSAYLVTVAVGYLLGSVAWGLIVGFLFTGKDIRNFGSGKTGTTNVLRTAGRLAAGLVLVADVAKGAIPALVGRYAFDDPGAAAAGGLAAVVGHIWPVFSGFRGGRGVATAFGGVLGLTPLLALSFPVVAGIIVGTTRVMSLMSIIAAPLAGLAIVGAWWAGWTDGAYALYAVAVVALIEYMHIPNIRRLLAGTEPRIGSGGDRPATG